MTADPRPVARGINPATGDIVWEAGAPNDSGADDFTGQQLAYLGARLLLPDLAASTAATGTLVAGRLARLNCGSASLARTLPAAATAGAAAVVAVRRTDTSTAYTATISPAGSDTINASASARVLAMPEVALTFVSDGVSNWSVVSTDTPASRLNGTYAQITDLLNTATTTGAALDGGFAKSPDPLYRWRAKFAQTPTAVVWARVGDSTMEEVSGGGQAYSRLRQFCTNLGEPLYGMPTDVFTDGNVTNGSPTLTSATAIFTQADVGKALVGQPTKIPATAYILSVQSSTSATMSANATATSSTLKFQVGRRIRGFGYSGLTLAGWLADSAKQAALIAAAPDLIELSMGINDVRLGLCDLPTMIARLQAFIAWRNTNLPTADLLLRVPNAMLSQNVGTLNYVQAAPGDGSSINPAGAAQAYSKLLRDAYMAIKGMAYQHVDVIDTQAEVTGFLSRWSHPLMADQLHPSVSGDQSNPLSGGYAAIADWVAGYVGKKWDGQFVNDAGKGYGTTVVFQCNGGGSGFIDLTSVGAGGIDPAHWPIDKSWSLLVPGIDGLMALTSTTITRPFSGGIGCRITSLPSPANTVDFSTLTGRRVALVNTAAWRMPTTGDRQVVGIDLPSIAAGATVTQTVTVTGANPGTSGSAAGISQANGVVVTPPSTFSSSGLLLFAAYPTATDTVTLIINNPTGGAIDRTSESWAFWLVR